MTGVYDSVEPVVIDEKLLQQCVQEQGPKGEAGKIAKAEGIDFSDVKELRMDFKNILKVDNLWQFTNLVKLQLDNNIIEKIEGLSSLVNLEWLDLSFNNIELIDGLETLTKLKDLTLFNNRIAHVANMDTLSDLQILSLGNNRIQNLDTLLYLRKFKNLNTLNLSGNPICKAGEYEDFTIAYLPSLVYLDYRLVDSTKRDVATERYKDSIFDIAHDEAIAEKKRIADEEKQAELMIHREAYVENLTELFDEMIDEDVEFTRLSKLPGVQDIDRSFKEDFTQVCGRLVKFGLSERVKRKEEINLFFTCLHEAIDDNQNDSVKFIEEFEVEKTQVFAELVTLSEQEAIESRLIEFSNVITQLWDSLMGKEMQLVDQLEDTVKDFERSIMDMVSSFVESFQELVSQLRELENVHHEKLTDISVVTLEKLMKNELEEEISDDVRMLFVDKDTIMNAISSSHDSHSSKIDNKEDDIVTRANNDVQSLIDNIHADEVKRNRVRVVEINTLLDHYRAEIENFEGNIAV